MSSLKQQLFQQSASGRVKQLVAEYKERFEPKKEDRFHLDGITYEFGTPVSVEGGIEFELSSKIPHEELADASNHKRYFTEVRKFVSKGRKRPISINMENIVREIGGDEVKTRDYVKLRYFFEDKELYDESEILKLAEEFRQPGCDSEPPKYNSINTLEGNLLVNAVGETIYEQARNSMDLLVEANQSVRTSLKKLRRSSSAVGKTATRRPKKPVATTGSKSGSAVTKLKRTKSSTSSAAATRSRTTKARGSASKATSKKKIATRATAGGRSTKTKAATSKKK